MQIVLYQDENLTVECDFDGYQRFTYEPDEDQEIVWSMNQQKAQMVFGFRIGGYSKKFNRPRLLEFKKRLCIIMDDKKRVSQFNKEIPNE